MSALLVVSAASLGCSTTPIWPFSALTPNAPHEAPPAVDQAPISSKTASPSSGPHIVQLAFDVMRVEMPIDGDMNSQKVWNHVDALRVGADTAAQLTRNGLHIAAGSKERWSAIRAILDAGQARTTRDQFVAQSGAPLLIELGTVADGESYFAYDKEMRLQGKTFIGGSKILQLDYAFRPELGGSTDLQVAFEIRRELGELVWERQGDGSIRQAPGLDRHVFEELKAALTVQDGEFLIIGPSAQAKNEYRVGGRFFLTGTGGHRKETLLFITPRPFQVEGSKKPV